MVIAHHLIWTAYGWWLPNDPRGSMSQHIASDVLRELGELHYGRKRIQPASHVIRDFYERAESKLKFPLLKLSEPEIDAIANAFVEVISREKYTCYACAIMPDHVHLCIRKHRDPAETMIVKLQESSRESVLRLKTRHLDHPVWSGGGWKVFLDGPQDVARTVKYVEDNPIKARLPSQSWSFVSAYDNWPFHKLR